MYCAAKIMGKIGEELLVDYPRDQAVQALAIGANGYNQLYAATKGIYLFPGNSNAFDPSQIFPILLILAFFFALYQFSTRGRRRSQSMLIT